MKIKEVESFVKPLYSKKDKFHSFSHIKRIKSKSNKLKMHYKEIDKDLLNFLIYFHGLKDYVNKNKSKIINFGFSEKFIESLNRHTKNPKTPEEKIVCDANNLENIGKLGIKKCLGFGKNIGRSKKDSIKFLKDNIPKIKFYTSLGKQESKKKLAYMKSWIKRNLKNPKRFQKLYDGFEKNELNKIWEKTKLEERAIKIQSKIVRRGKKALQITIHKGDKIQKGDERNKTSERDELLERKEFGPMENEGFSYVFSMYIPKNFPIVPTRLVLAQWKQNEENDNALIDNPLLALRYQKGELFITLQTTNKKVRIFRTNKEIRGEWLDFVFQVKFTRKENGFVRVWMNKKQIVDFNGVTAYSEKYNYPKPGHFYFKMGLYRDQMDEPMTIYIDEFKKYHLI
jgi:hypothetical protein